MQWRCDDSKEHEIWVIGAHNTNADKCISWYQQFPNLSDPDILIINLNSLTEDILRRKSIGFYSHLRDKIFDKFINGGIIVFITAPRLDISEQQPNSSNKSYESKVKILNPTIQYSNYFFSPVSFEIESVPEGHNIVIEEQTKNDGYNFSSYLSKVRNFNYYLHNFKLSDGFQELVPTNEYSSTIVTSLRNDNVRSGQDSKSPTLDINVLAKDNSNHTISATCQLKVYQIWESGSVIYLPPLAKISIEESIDIILQIFGKIPSKEPFPDWINGIKLHGLEEVIVELRALNTKKRDLEILIKDSETRRSNLENHYRLLTSKGHTLEVAVRDAFKVLGFNEIERRRDHGKEDWVFKFQTITEFKYGVIEVKGSDSRTSEHDLSQTSKWVQDYFGEYKEIVKGIFIPNQYRFEDYTTSRANRLRFEPNEFKFANFNNLCILPSCILFETINQIFKQSKKSRKDFEKAISDSKGLLDKLI